MPDALPQNDGNLNEVTDHLWSAIVRRRWPILLVASGTTFLTLVALSFLPNRYRSEASLLVVQQQVPERYVLPTSTTDIREALQVTTQEVLSHARLLAIINEFDLYPKQAKLTSPEGLLGLMQRDIGIQPAETAQGRTINSFKISFMADSPELARAVTTRLTSLFIEQHLETREHQATTTTTFLQEQLESAKSKLEEAEKLVGDYKLHHLGELPEQQAGNLAILGGLQSQLQGTLSSLNRAREQKQYLESLSDNRGLMIQGDLARLQSQREALLLRYTPGYPAIKRLDEKIAQTQALFKTLRASQASENPPASADQTPSPGLGIAEDTSIAQLNSQLEANRLEIENLTRDKKRLEATIAQYQERINQTPIREQEIIGMLRNYDLMKQDYSDLLSKKIQSELAGDLEKRQEGQQFRLVDPASLSTVPASPNRAKISLGGMAAGLGLGLAVAFLMEMRDRSFHSEEDLSQRFALPLVIGVPLLLTPVERRSREIRRNFEWVLGSGLALAVAAAELYELYFYRLS
jgi:polysaccharide chain length determinant protein (PEP-CTERM system associated)